MSKKSAIEANRRRIALNPIWEDKAAITLGRPTGRITLSQIEYLERLGIPRAKSVHWTAYRAQQEYLKLKAKMKAKTDSTPALHIPTPKPPKKGYDRLQWLLRKRGATRLKP